MDRGMDAETDRKYLIGVIHFVRSNISMVEGEQYSWCWTPEAIMRIGVETRKLQKKSLDWRGRLSGYL